MGYKTSSFLFPLLFTIFQDLLEDLLMEFNKHVKYLLTALFIAKHFKYKKVRETHVICYQLSFSDLCLVYSKFGNGRNYTYYCCRLLFLNVQVYLISLSSRLACISNTERLQMLVQNNIA
jgi:hypothetical protein